jgi:hypothetical protein
VFFLKYEINFLDERHSSTWQLNAFFGIKGEDKAVFMHATKACMGSGDVTPPILNLDTV